MAWYSKFINKGREGKICSRCGRFKSPSEFPHSSQHKDGLHSYCRPCHSQYMKVQRMKKHLAVSPHLVREDMHYVETAK